MNPPDGINFMTFVDLRQASLSTFPLFSCVAVSVCVGVCVRVCLVCRELVCVWMYDNIVLCTCMNVLCITLWFQTIVICF